VTAILQQRNIVWIPEIVSSAGAVISDSIEHYAPEVFQQAKPEAVYDFIGDLIFKQTSQLLAQDSHLGDMNQRLHHLVHRKEFGAVCGLNFQLTS
jgi:hypothetical protein